MREHAQTWRPKPSPFRADPSLQRTSFWLLFFSTLARMCAVLECTPADLLDYAFDPADLAELPE